MKHTANTEGSIKLFLIIVSYCIVFDNLRQEAFCSLKPKSRDEKTNKVNGASSAWFPVIYDAEYLLPVREIVQHKDGCNLFMVNVSTAFKVINERNCPFYELNDLFILNNQSLRVPDGQPSCLILVREFTNILFAMAPGSESENPALKERVFSCGGCIGLIKFRKDKMPEGMEKITVDPEKITGAGSSEAAAGRLKKSNPVVSGTLEAISPSELLQFFHMHQKTGKLLLEVSRGTARVAFREGSIIGARYGDREDTDAIFQILGEKWGKFSFLTGIPQSLMEVDAIGDFMMILMEGLKRLDESREEAE